MTFRHLPAANAFRDIACTYPACALNFATLDLMRTHKQQDPEHHYCRKCDTDCADWMDLTQHKVDAMAPWLETSNHPALARKNPKHIVCEFCGEDFKSFGGRKKHRSEMHQAEQHITCAGCKRVFVKASLMVRHLEMGACGVISALVFRGWVNMKFLQGELDREGTWGELNENLHMNPQYALPEPGARPGEIIEDGVAGSMADGRGGVLLDQVDEGQGGGARPLEIETDLIEVHGQRVPLTRANLEQWPRFPGKVEERNEDGPIRQYLEKLRIADTGLGVNDSIKSPASNDTSRRGGVKVLPGSIASMSSPPLTPNCGDSFNINTVEDTASNATATPSKVLDRQPNWHAGIKALNPPAVRVWGQNTTSTLFPSARPTPPSAAARIRNAEHALATQPADIRNVRFWDSTQRDYDPERFFNPLLEKYTCPFPGCDTEPVATPADLDAHFRESHVPKKFRCEVPSCYKIFKTPSALVAHCESNSRCGVKGWSGLKLMLETATGGFLAAKRLPEPAVFRPSAVVKVGGQAVNGLLSTQFKGTLPRCGTERAAARSTCVEGEESCN